MDDLRAPPAISDEALRRRASAALDLACIIARCDPRDAVPIMAAALDDLATDGPQRDVFGGLKLDAEWWAETAPPHEVQAYVYAGLKQLVARPIGPKARARFFAALWNGMPDDDKQRFLRSATRGNAG